MPDLLKSSVDQEAEVLVRVENVSKKFCRSLRRSLWYGVTDVFAASNPFGNRGCGSGEVAIDQSEGLPPLRRDEFWAVKNVSFELRRGECIGLIGHNGAGKSTLLKVLNGLIPPDTGKITMKGRVCALIELNAGFNPILTGRENIYNQAALLGFSREETDAKFDQIVEFSEIVEFIDMPVQNYSSGMKVRLGFAVAAQMEPDVLIIDEVLAVGDVAFRFKCLNAIGELMKTSAVIFVTHTMPQVFRICSEVVVLDHGAVTCQTNQIGDGVAVYLSLFKGGGANVAGSGEVKVLGLQIDDGTGAAALGETLTSRIGCRLKISARLHLDFGKQNVRVQFLFWSAEMLPVMDIVDVDLNGFEIQTNGNRVVTVTTVVSKVELNAGKYSLSVIVVSEDMRQVLCRHDNAAFVQIVAASASGAYVLVAAEWMLIANEEVESLHG